MESIMNSNNIDPKEIEWITHCAGGDHANVKFRFLAKSIVKTYTGKCYVDIYSLVDVGCKKDHGEILDNSIMKQMCWMCSGRDANWY